VPLLVPSLRRIEINAPPNAAADELKNHCTS
jgi:hypothetical protein